MTPDSLEPQTPRLDSTQLDDTREMTIAADAARRGCRCQTRRSPG